ncbi:OmpA family protein [Nocardiopsis sp. CT-R113]|uniref:OmpA family protein n=1 Tax=Nocardiopsis codii TaxID=3065942 RepID=A0ABU7K5P8_9ACTN|nr:OmpA family protein [Nocardiopsis sp. CT-R113]MEE2037571.1 OmpA family protein [Nocardiopsis sp. CT-R113]
MNPPRTALAAITTLALLIAPPVLLGQQTWPDIANVSGDHLRLSLLSAALPPPVLHTLALALLWLLWAAFALLVAADAVALLRGQAPRIGLLRLAATGIAGTSAAVSAPAVAAVAPADSTPTAGAQDAHGAHTDEPVHVVERTRTLGGFGLGSADLTPAMTEDLGPTVELLRLFGDPGTPITVSGHTDATGPDEYNRALSRQRAEAVAAALTAHLGEGWSITAEGAGSGRPRAHPDLGPSADRRAEITYTLTTAVRGAADSPAEHEERTADGHGVDAPVTEAEDTGALPVGAVLAGAVAGGAVGAVTGRLTAPGRRGRHRDPEDGLDTGPYDSGPFDDGSFDDGLAVEEPLGEPVPVVRGDDGSVVSAQGYVRVADNLGVSARDGLGVTGTHAVGVCASLIGRALADPDVRVITTREVMDRAGASFRVRAPDMTVSADTASAVTEAQLAYITAARDDGVSSRTLLVVEATGHARTRDRLRSLRDGDGEAVALILGEERGSPTVRCDAFDSVGVTALDGTTATYEGLRLLHVDQATFAAHFTTAVEEPRPAEADVSVPPETGRGEAVPDGQGQPGGTGPAPAAESSSKVGIQLFAPQPRITVDGVDIGTRMRASSRTMLAYLALHPDGVGTDALTDALFPDSAESKARSLRNTACTSARGAVREALDDPAAEIIDVALGRYRIRHDLVDVDVWRFDRSLGAARSAHESETVRSCLQAAANEYGHLLLTESELPWMEEKRESYRRAAADCFVGLAKATGDARRALTWLERARESDDLNEAVYQELMRAQAGAGRPDAVERTYQDLADRLKAMRARPSAATRNLLADLTSTFR